MQSRERSSALKRDKYTCVKCGRKQSKAKGKEFSVEVHHKNGIDGWEQIINLVYENLLTHPDTLETICHDCHRSEHDKP